MVEVVETWVQNLDTLHQRIVRERNIALDAAPEQAAQTLETNGKTACFVATNHTVVGLVGVADVLRDDVKEALHELEPGIARFFARLDPAKEGVVETAQRRLATGEIGVGQGGGGGAITLQLGRLILVADAPLFVLPRSCAFSQRTIVQLPVGSQHLSHRSRLLAGRVQAVAERFAHPCIMGMSVTPGVTGREDTRRSGTSPAS